MAKVLSQSPVADGYDVRLIASDGQAYTIHYVKPPKAEDVTQSVESFEKALSEKPDVTTAALQRAVTDLADAAMRIRTAVAEKPELTKAITDKDALAVLNTGTGKN